MVLLLPMHRMPLLLGFLPLWYRPAEITMMGRELINLRVAARNGFPAAANCYRTGNHPVQPHTIKSNSDYMLDDIEEHTGIW